MGSSDVSTYSSTSGTGLDRMRLSSELPYDAAYASDFFSAARIQQLDREVHVKFDQPEHHRITLWSPGTNMFDVRSDGKRRADAIMPKGIAAVATAFMDSEYWLGPHNGANFCFFIDSRHFQKVFQDDSSAGRLVELRSDLCTTDPFFARMMRAYLNEVEHASHFSAVAIQTIAMEIGLHLARNYSTILLRPTIAVRRAAESMRMQRAKDFILDNLEQPISLAQIAGAASLSQFHFARVFKSNEGITPHQYVIKQRLERARVLVCETRQPLADIAAACGFCSQQHLTDVFRKAFGVPPGEMRRQRHS